LSSEGVLLVSLQGWPAEVMPLISNEFLVWLIISEKDHLLRDIRNLLMLLLPVDRSSACSSTSMICFM
jgi:hypothetical protein